MKKHFLLLTFIFTICSTTFSQVTFRKTYEFSGNPSKVISTSDGGYLLAGSTYFTDSAMNTTAAMFVVKTNSMGDTLWVKAFRTNGNTISAFESFDHGIILTGNQMDSVNQSSGYRVFIKLDSLGNLLWKRHLPGESPALNITVYDFIQVSDSGFILLEQILDTIYQNGVDIFKFDKDGYIQWYKRVVPNNPMESMTGVSLIENRSGNLFITGYNQTGSNLNHTWLLQTDKNGDIIKCQNFTSPPFFYVTHLENSADGNIILFGLYLDSASGNNRDPIIIKCDSVGNLLWAKAYSIPLNPILAFDITSNPDFTSTFTYEYRDSAFYRYNNVVHIDSSGDVLWGQVFSNPPVNDGIISLDLTSDSGYILRFQNQELIKTDSYGLTGCNDSSFASIESVLTMTLSDITNDIHDSTAIFNHLNIGLRDTTFNFPIATYCFNTVGTDEIKSTETYQAFPNPFSNYTFINVGEQTGKTGCQVYDLTGKLVAKYVSANGIITIYGNEMHPGIYFGILVNENKYLGTIKLIVQ